MTDEQILVRAYISVAERCADECESKSYEKMQYKAVKKACEKFVPRRYKPFAQLKICPVCHDVLNDKQPYCKECGQAIDWGKK